MLTFIFFCLLIIIQFFISLALIKNLYRLFYLFFKNESKTIQLVTWLLLPGTVVHEVSHMITAEVLGVRTGEFSFVPEIMEENKVKAGSLKLAKTGPLRQSLIGLAPIFIGLLIIFSLIHFFFLPIWSKTLPLLFPITNYQLLITNLIIIFAICYLLLVVSNTMFSSSKDLETILFPLIIIALIIGALWLGGISFKITLSAKLVGILTEFLKKLCLGLGMAILINLILLGSIKIFSKIWR